MNKDFNLLDGKISEYFNSVSDQFEYRLRNQWKIDFTNILHGLAVMLVVINVFPLLPLLVDNYLLRVFDSIKGYIGLNQLELNFWIEWTLGVLCSFAILACIYPIYKFWDKKDKKKATKSRQTYFCYAFIVRRELKKALLNENYILDKSLGYFKKVVENISTIYVSKADKGVLLKLSELKETLSGRFDRIRFTKESEELIHALSQIDKKVTERLRQRQELDKITKIIDLLVLFEFSKIKPAELNEEGKILSVMRVEYLKELVTEISKLNDIEVVVERTGSKRNRVIGFLENLLGLFTHQNPLILFLSWLILLGIIFTTACLVIFKNLEIKSDSTLLVGLISTPFLGALGIATTIFKRHKND